MQPLNVEHHARALDGNYVLVLTTNSVERKAITSHLRHSAKAFIPPDNDGARLGLVGEQIVLHVTGTSGGQADKAVGRIARQILRHRGMPTPKAVVLVGIGWGAPAAAGERVVILSGQLFAVNQLRFDGATPRHMALPRSSPWASDIEGLAADMRVSGYPEIVCGVLASGEQFLAHDGTRDALLSALPSVIGGEMEGWDLVPDLEGLPWAQIRGVSDLGGDETNRLHQFDAANGAAGALEPFLRGMEARGRLEATRRNPATVALLEALAGEAMQIEEPSDGLSLTEHLNYRLGPSLAWRLAQYSVGGPPTPNASGLAANLLLEMAQNALRHGNATHATIRFGAASITYSDDGKPFDVFHLLQERNGRGGRDALKGVLDHLVARGAVELSPDPSPNSAGNRYRVRFPLLSARLRQAREKCSIIVPFTGYGLADAASPLQFDPMCETLFFDASELMMSSQRFDVVVELRKLLLDDGKQLIVQCVDEHSKAFYEDALSDAGGGRVEVIVVPLTQVPGGINVFVPPPDRRSYLPQIAPRPVESTGECS